MRSLPPPTLLPPPRDPLISGLGAPRRNARYCHHRRRVFLESTKVREAGSEMGPPYLIFTPSFITLPLHFSGGALSWATSKCLRRRSLQFYLYFEYGSGSESQGPDSHFGQNLGLAMEHWIRSLAIEHVSFGKCRQDRPSSVGHLTC